MSNCPRLSVELAHIDPHADPDEVARRVTDHQRWHACDHDPRTGTPHLPRDPERTP